MSAVVNGKDEGMRGSITVEDSVVVMVEGGRLEVDIGCGIDG